MRALTKVTAGPGLELVDRPEPACGPLDVKVRVLRAGLCGTDLHLQQWDDWAASTVKAPMVIGHEFYGEIVQVGEDVPAGTAVAVGARVSGEGHIVCGHCRNCRAGRRHVCINTVGIGVNRDGAFADYIVLPATNVWVQPDTIDPDLGAIFDPLGNATHTALQWPLVGEDVLITGAGPIGCMAIAVAKHAGARKVVITDINDGRLELAKKFGPTRAVNTAKENLSDVWHKELGMTEGFDVGLEMSGSHLALNQMIDNMIMGGRIALLGTHSAKAEVDWNKIVFKMLHLKGIYGREMFETWYKMTALVQGGMDITPVITHRMSVDNFQEGFELMGAGKSGKIVLNWET